MITRTLTLSFSLICLALGACSKPSLSNGADAGVERPAAPAGLTYSANPVVYTKGQEIARNTPASTGGAVSSYAIAPALPAGLSFDTQTGVLSGTPTAVSPTADYTVTATNSGGSTTATLTLTVNDAPPSELAYSTNPAVYTLGQPIENNTPTSSGGGVSD